MDFEFHYTEEQERFRKEVRAWIDANLPLNFKLPDDPGKETDEMHELVRQFRRKLGGKGWGAPTLSREYGGGGLSRALATIISEELAARGLGGGGGEGSSPILVWGTEEQKRRFLPLMARGEAVSWRCFNEPDAGSDLASLKTTAVRDGDDYILNGEKIFIGNKFDADYLNVLAVTDPTKPRHQNIGHFMVPAHLPGITIITLDLFATSPLVRECDKRHIFFDNVRVPAIYLIGGESDGWTISQSALAAEHAGEGGGGGAVITRHPLFERLLACCKETQRNGQPLSKDPDVQQALVEMHLQVEIEWLFAMRNRSMGQTRKRGIGYEGVQYTLHRKTYGSKIATLILQGLGPLALINDPEWAPLEGEIERQQRNGYCTHPGGTREVIKLLMVRGMGIRRATRETADATA